MGALGRHPDHPQYRRVMRVIELIEFGILAVDSQCILSQIVRSDAEEINFLRQFAADHNGRRGLDHDAQFHILFIRDAFALQLFFHLANDLFDLLHFFYRDDHREHNGNVSEYRRTVEGAKLCLEDLRPCQADPDRAVTERRVLLFVKPEIIYLLVRSDIEGTDDDLLAGHALRHFLIYGKLLLFRREI